MIVGIAVTMIVRSCSPIRLDVVARAEGDNAYQSNEEEGQVEGNDRRDELLEGGIFWVCF